ncbi:MAG: hypothetical protein RSH78_03920 [Bacilli bacterium]|uniref:hypothetical protein n=1 Tax=Clostridium sp. TaxID=1506 RepID=UPI002FC932FD
MFKVLENYYEVREEENIEVFGCTSVDLDVYPGEKRAIVYFIDSAHMVEIFKVEKGFYCTLMTELEEKVIYKKLVRKNEHLIELLEYYEDICICGKVDKIKAA